MPPTITMTRCHAGFLDIAGMTAQDDFLTEEEEPYAMYKKPAWQRVIVERGVAQGKPVNLEDAVKLAMGGYCHLRSP